MFEKWYESNRKLRFLSQLSTFLITLFSILSFYDMLVAISYNKSALNSVKNNLVISGIFHIALGLLFASRFIVLFFNAKRFFVISQIVWSVCIFSIIAYHLTTRFTLYGAYFPTSSISLGVDNYYPIVNFLYAGNGFGFLIFFYCFLSPARQVITLISAYFKSK